MSKIEDSVLPNRKFDVKELPIVYFSEKKDSEILNKQFIKNTTKQAEDELNILSILYFSDENIDLINKQLVLRIYKVTNKKYRIPFQSKDNLLIVMRYVWIQYSKNLDFNIKEQIKKLNCIVVSEITPQIVTNVDQYYGYIRDVEIKEKSKFDPIALPISSSNGKKVYPSISETFHGGIRAPF